MQEDIPPRKINICSWKTLERILGFPQETLRSIAKKSGRSYSPFLDEVKSRPFQKIFKPSKKRPIDNPTGQLKEVQKRIQRRILKRVALPDYLCGGVTGKTVLDNVLLHFGARRLVTLDIRSFFPSISNLQVYSVWANTLGCSPLIASWFTKVTTFERHLPQGAPTSTFLANLVLYSVDENIRSGCTSHGIKYSSWVDDLAFSGEYPQAVVGMVITELSRAGFRISRKKFNIMGPGDRKTLNGVLMGKFPNVLPERLAQIRSGIHKLRTGRVAMDEIPDYCQSLQGRITHVSNLNPRKAAKLQTAFDSAKLTAFRGKI